MGCTCSLQQSVSLKNEEIQDERIQSEQNEDKSKIRFFRLRIQKTDKYFYENNSEKMKKNILTSQLVSQQQITTKQFSENRVNSSNNNSSNFLSQKKDANFLQLEKEQESQQILKKRNSNMLEKLMESEKNQPLGQVQTEFHKKKQFFESMIQSKQRNTVKDISEYTIESFYSQEFLRKDPQSFLRMRAKSENTQLKSILKKNLRYQNQSSSSGSSTNKKVSFQYVTHIYYSLKEKKQKNQKLIKKLKSLREKKQFYMDQFEN